MSSSPITPAGPHPRRGHWHLGHLPWPRAPCGQRGEPGPDATLQRRPGGEHGGGAAGVLRDVRPGEGRGVHEAPREELRLCLGLGPPKGERRSAAHRVNCPPNAGVVWAAGRAQGPPTVAEKVTSDTCCHET